MREIKFRGYDKKENEMFYSSMYQDKTSMAYGLSNFLSECSDIEDTLMQYTGLKDKNGVKIYEGDILKDGGRFWKIEISPIYGIFFILSKGLYTRCYGDFASYLVDDFQVIGNIYENKELLES